ncbi:hypothetical protein A0H76_168 [Hepatospora eriocheir]|uniref:Uncharacterized protein n=1 Tax=Hepatospora eriocheir TaxID=1081669 RepID=A0A1X0QBB6_9MICR|nr:hypothetical protein HERIO_1095 [Hepatospora eriocheir]ORD99794.1 hypothetical protein A0H76_168 [Hepatospora eriocheir]
MGITITFAEQLFGFLINALSIGPGKNMLKDKERFTVQILAVYLISKILTFVLFMYIRSKILKRNNQTSFKTNKTVSFGVTEEIEMKYIDYDLEECNKNLKGEVFGLLINLGMFYKFRNLTSLVSSAFNILKPILFNGLVREYVYGQYLVRPFEDNDIFGKKIGPTNIASSNERQAEVKEPEEKEVEEILSESSESNEESSDNDEVRERKMVQE